MFIYFIYGGFFDKLYLIVMVLRKEKGFGSKEIWRGSTVDIEGRDF